MEDYADFKVREWGLIPEISGSGLQSLLKNPLVRLIHIQPSMLSADVISALQNSSVNHLVIEGESLSELPSPDVIPQLQHLSILTLLLQHPLNDTDLEMLRKQIPKVEVRQGNDIEPISH